MKKIQRNDQCYCGSGKKYKNCCIAKDKQNMNIENMDADWVKIRRTEGELIDLHLLPYVLNELPDETMVLGWDDFLCSENEEFLEEIPENLYNQTFLPWFLFNWVQEKDENLTENIFEDRPIAIQYLEARGEKLNAYQKCFLKTICKTHYSFYLVLEVEPEKSLLLKDILLNKEYRVKERQGTRHLRRGEIAFARVLELDDQAICVGLAPWAIRAHYHLRLLDFRDELVLVNKGKKLTPELLRNKFEAALLWEFFNILEELFNPPMTKLHNTDGEVFQPCEVCFKLKCDSQTAIEKLLPLTLNGTLEEIMENDAKYDASGKLESVDFPWLKKGNKQHKEWDNTLMGNVIIKDNNLFIDVNSEKRANKIKKLIIKYLGELADFKVIVQESVTQALEKQQAFPSSNNQAEESINFDATELEIIKKLAKQHWENWLDESIPALNGMTPREAAKNKKGKERLEALLLEFETKERPEENLYAPDLGYIRKQLELN